MSENVRDSIINSLRTLGFSVDRIIDDLIVVERESNSITVDLTDSTLSGATYRFSEIELETPHGHNTAIVTRNGFVWTSYCQSDNAKDDWKGLVDWLHNILDSEQDSGKVLIAAAIEFTSHANLCSFNLISSRESINLIDLHGAMLSSEYQRFLEHYFAALFNIPVLTPIYAHRALNSGQIQEINHSAQVNYSNELFYRPVGVDLEILNRCTLECPECAILDEVKIGKDKIETAKLNQILEESRSLGMYAYSVTGGEPFIRINDICELIESNHGMDCFKIQTNGTYFSSVEKSKELIRKLTKSGFGVTNRKISSTLLYSIGIQNYPDGAELKNLTHLLYALQELEIWEAAPHFQLGLGVTVRQEEDVKERDTYFRRFVSAYVYRSELVERIHFSLYPILYSESQGSSAQSNELVPFNDLLAYYNLTWPGCFNSSETVWPRPIIKANGDMYTCGCFGYGFKAGNIHKSSVIELIQSANQVKPYKLIYEHGVAGAHQQGLMPNSAQMNSMSVPSNTRMCSLCGLLTGKSNRSTEELISIGSE